MEKHHSALIIIGLLLFSGFFFIPSVSNASSTPSYTQAIALPNGHHFYIRYANFTESEQIQTENYLTLYIPLISDLFWQPSYDVYVLVYTKNDANTGGAWPVYDSTDNLLYYSGTVTFSSLGTNFTSMQDPGNLHLLLHEFTHVFQYTIVPDVPSYTEDDYLVKMTPYLEGIANIVPSILMYQQMNCLYSQSGYSRNERVASFEQNIGEAGYLQDALYHGSNAAPGWMELYTINQDIFNDFNSLYLSNKSLGVRDILKNVMLNYSYYSFNGVSIDDWLDGFSFYNSIADIPENSNMLSWWALNSFQCIPNAAVNESLFMFQGLSFTNHAGTGSFVPVSTYHITVSDAQTREILYNSTGSGPSVYTFLLNLIPSRQLLRVDLKANYSDNSEVNLTAYVARQSFSEYNLGVPPIKGDKVIFFLNNEGYAAGNGISNVGSISNGTLTWNSFDFDILANVTYNSHTYSYNIQNILANSGISITQIGINLQEANVILSPVPQTINDKAAVILQAHISPLVSTGSVTFYSSQDNLHWTQVAQTVPIDGSANATILNLPVGHYYFKALWAGDGYLNQSSSSPIETSIVSYDVSYPSPNPTRTPAPTAAPSPSPTPTENPTPTVTPTPTPTPTQSESPSPTPSSAPSSSSGSGQTSSSSSSSTSKPVKTPSATPTIPELSTACILASLMLSASLVALYKRKHHQPKI